VGKNVLDFSEGAPIMIAKNNYFVAELSKTKWQTLGDRFLFLVTAVFINNYCVQFANVSRNGGCYINGEFSFLQTSLYLIFFYNLVKTN
jgi:hypothetical protein